VVHQPVLQKEVIEYLDPKANKNFIDCTIDGGGHAFQIIEKILPEGRLLGIDWDPEIMEPLRGRAKKLKVDGNLILACDNFSNLKKITEELDFKKIWGILFDLGMSSWHLQESKKGFSFLRKEPLDMRYNPESNPFTAQKLLNYWSSGEIEKILKEYGQERFARQIARAIIEERAMRPIENTLQLAAIIKRSVPKNYEKGRIHPATRTFQALRIAVNNELENLKKALPQALELLEKRGRLVLISFHSLEDKIIKNFYREKEKEGKLEILNKKPIIASKEEIRKNPASRSAKMRVAIKK